MNRSIVCGVDGSPDSQLALTFAAQWARWLGARLIVANVVADGQDPLAPGFSYAPMARPVMLGPVNTARGPDADVEAAEAMLERIVLDAGVDDAELRAIIGIPAEGLADLADDEGAEVIVVGSRGRGAFKAVFLGSVSNSLVGIARCPVLVVPPGAAEAAAAA